MQKNIIGLKNKNYTKEKRLKNGRRKKENKSKTPPNCKSPMQMQRFMITRKSMPAYTQKYVHL